MDERDASDRTGVTGPQNPRNDTAEEIEETVTEEGGGPAGVAVPQGWTPDEEGNPRQE